MSKLSILCAAVLLVSTAAMAAPPASFTQNFDSLATGNYAGDANLIVRNGASAQVQVTADGANKFLTWTTGADEHLAIAGTYSDAADYDFNLTFKMAATNASGYQGFQYGWEDQGGASHMFHIGRDLATGGLDAADRMFAVTGLSFSNQWANVRVQKKLQSLNVKMWAPGTTEPSEWTTTLTLDRFWNSGNNGLSSESGLRFKWSAGLQIDDVACQNLAIVPGDATGDDMVDVGDLGVLGFNYGQVGIAGSRSVADFNGDHAVDVGDLGILGANYGLGSAGAVPEPATLSLLALGVVGLIRRRNA